MPYILALYFVSLVLFGLSLVLISVNELLLVAWVSLFAGLSLHNLMGYLSHRQRRTRQLMMFSRQVMPYIHLVHPTCNYTNLNK